MKPLALANLSEQVYEYLIHKRFGDMGTKQLSCLALFIHLIVEFDQKYRSIVLTEYKSYLLIFSHTTIYLVHFPMFAKNFPHDHHHHLQLFLYYPAESVYAEGEVRGLYVNAPAKLLPIYQSRDTCFDQPRVEFKIY